MNKPDKYHSNNIVVKESLVHGKGIFASEDIPEGEIILVIEGEVIDGIECERREEEENNVYIFWNGDDCFIDTFKTEKIKYINHDCSPNCYVDEGECNELLLISQADIKAGDELTIDYGYEEIYEHCNCQICRNRVKAI